MLHYRDNTRIGDVVVTATQEGVVLAKDREAVAEMKDIGTSVGYFCVETLLDGRFMKNDQIYIHQIYLWQSERHL